MGILDSAPLVVVAVGATGIPGYQGVVDQSDVEEFLCQQGMVVDQAVVAERNSALAAMGVMPAELATVDKSMYGDLILEKVALVDLLK